MHHNAHTISTLSGYMSIDELDYMQGLVRQFTCKVTNPVAVNISTDRGSDVGIAECHQDMVVFSVDSDDPLESELLTSIDRDVAKRIINVVGNSEQVGAVFPYNINVLLLDGNHNREGLVYDLTLWVPHLTRNGLLLVHDYGNKEWPEVKSTVDEFANLYPTWKDLGHIGTLKAFQMVYALSRKRK